MAMIKIFNATDRDFTTAGNVVIEPTKCIEFKKKSLNGWYIEVEMPIKYKEYIEKDKLCVIKTKSKLNPQAFRVEENIKYTNRKISFTAVHVMFDAERYYLLDVRPTNLNGLNALNYINSRTDNISPFTVYSNVENLSTAYFIRKTLLEAWEVIEERWNGVFDADNWNISFMQSVGHDNGETIIYGKNMQSMEIYEDWSSVTTKLYPVGYDGIMLPEKYITSDVQYEIPYTRKVEFQTELEDDEKTEANLIAELRNNANAYIQENKYPKVSYTTASNINNDMEIGDTIQVLHPLISIQTEVMEYEYNIISKRIISMTFGNYSRDVKKKFNNIKNTITQINQEISKQEIAINNQTNLINSLNKNGYIYIDENEILILDALPKEEAHNVWRWNMGGLGFSSNGYEGPFETAITIDGSINANFITTGTLAVSRIEGLGNIIESVVSNVTEQNNKISTLTQTVDELSSKISDVADVTVHGESNFANVYLEDINESEPIMVKIHPITYNIDLLYSHSTLYPSDTTYLKTRILRFIRTYTEDGTTKTQNIDYELPEDLLYYDNETYDEFYLDYDSHTCQVTKRCGYNADGTVYALENEEIHTYEYPLIELGTGNYQIKILNHEYGYLFVRLMATNIYTTQFATKVELSSSIEQTTQNIDLSINQKFSNYSTTNEMNTAIQLAKDNITSTVSSTYITKINSANNIATAKQEAIDSANNSTDTKLEDYYTKTETESKISQSVNQIAFDVSATYLTKSNASNTYLTQNNASNTYLTQTNASNTYLTQSNASATYETKTSVAASLSLKIDKTDNDQIVSMINASADRITLNAGRLVINSGRFQLDSQGNVLATSGEVGGFTLSDDGFAVDITNPYTYTRLYDEARIRKIVDGIITPTTEDYEKYDVDNDGEITGQDGIYIGNLIDNQEQGNARFLINANSPKTSIQFINADTGKTIANIGRFCSYFETLQADKIWGKEIWINYQTENDYQVRFFKEALRFYDYSGNGYYSSEFSARGLGFWKGTGTPIYLNAEDGNISCRSLTQTSKAEEKKNFTKLKNGLDIIKNTDIYEYNFNFEEDKDKKHIGFVIGDDYKYRQELTSKNNDGVDVYSMISVAYKAIQEQQEQIEELQQKLEYMGG